MSKIQNKLPYDRFLQTLTVGIVIITAFGSAWVLLFSQDDLVKGGVIATWTLLLKSAWDFWFGSSSGGKMSSRKDQDDVNGTETSFPKEP